MVGREIKLIILFVLLTILCACENKTEFSCKCEVGEYNHELKVTGTARDVGIEDVVYERKFCLYKDGDSLNFSLNNSERKGVYFNNYVDSSGSFMVLYNADANDKVFIELEKFKVVDKNTSDWYHIVRSQDFFEESEYICGN